MLKEAGLVKQINSMLLPKFLRQDTAPILKQVAWFHANLLGCNDKNIGIFENLMKLGVLD